MGWFERLEDPSGGIAFTPVAGSEEELRELISRITQGKVYICTGWQVLREVSEEFMEQSPSYSDSPDDSGERADEDDQQYTA